MTKKTTKPAEDEDDELLLDESMPDDDSETETDELEAVEVDDIPDDERFLSPEQLKKMKEAGDSDDEELPDVIVTQPKPVDDTDGPAPSEVETEPMTAANATMVMDLTSAVLDEIAASGQSAWWKGKEIAAAVAESEGGLWELWKKRGSIPGKSFSGVDGADAITIGPSKARFDYPISWNAKVDGTFTAKVWAFGEEWGPTAAIDTDADNETAVRLLLANDVSLDATEAQHLAQFVKRVADVAAWFTKANEAAGEDDGE